MEKIKIYLNKKECKEYDEAKCLSQLVDVILKHNKKIRKLINLNNYRVLDCHLKNETPHFYSLMIKLEEKEENATK